MSDVERWNAVYEHKRPDQVSWFQREPTMSLALLDEAGLAAGQRVVDVGGGASTLVDHLLERGCDVTVLDLARRALELSQERLGDRASLVRWIAGDVTTTPLPGPYDVWHDRAVFHFLTEAAQRQAYVHQLSEAVRPGGVALLATFAPEGPERCSGLPVVRYSEDELACALAPDFTVVTTRRELHHTPAGGAQAFVYGLFRRNG